jgi:cytoskeletal protein RodZ
MMAFEIVDEFSDQIGGRLAEARQEAGLSIDDVIFRTRIPRGVINALEAGDFTFFSSPTYAKSFLGQYSSFLGVEATRWLDALQPAYFVTNEAVGPLLSPTESRKEVPERDSERSGNLVSALTLFAVTAGLLFVAVKGYEYLDARFSTEINVPAGSKTAVVPVAPQIPVPQVTSKSSESPIIAPQPSEEVLSEPPPRAVIVR